ncbi:MAG: hypothetical protein SPK36_03200 [Bacilli bacterium]|nr:hypothetical protein [Bacilli bacterium]
MKLKKVYLLLALASLLLLVSVIQNTYAKYISKATANSNFTIASWNFKVNNQDINANSNFSNVIVPVFENNPNIKDNVIAPTSEGYFDINIDHSNVDVSFTEKINLNFSGTNTVSDLKITGYAINDGSIIEFNGNEISTDCLLSDNVKINKYRFYVTWIDDDGQTMQNKDDTEAAKNGNASISVSLSFIQKAK